MDHATVFMIDESQAIRLPKEVALPAHKLEEERVRRVVEPMLSGGYARMRHLTSALPGGIPMPGSERLTTTRLLRDAKLYEIGAGTSEIRRMLIGRELFEESA